MPPFAHLPDQLRFEGEFGAEINSFLPFVHWLWDAGALGGRRIVTYRGMTPFYGFLPLAQLTEIDAPRRYVPPCDRPFWLPTRDDHGPRRRCFESFPDYRTLHANDLFTAGADTRPLLVLHNKFCTEWDHAPVNFLPLDLLAETLAALQGTFRIVYSRPGIAPPGRDYSADHQPDHDLGERDLLAAFPDVILFEDLAAQLAPLYGYNQLKLMLYAKTYFHITTQGGNAHLAALFGGSLLGIYHRAGQELRHSYHAGHFTHAAHPTPTLLIAQDPAQYEAMLPLFAAARLIGNRVHLHPDHVDYANAPPPSTNSTAPVM